MNTTATAASTTATGSTMRVDVLGLVGAVAATLIVLALPTPAGLPEQGHRLAALFAGALVLWSTEALPIAVTSVLVLALQPIFGLASLVPPPGRPTMSAMLGAAIANSMSSPFFFVLVMFAIAFAWIKTGLARRFALWMISKAGTSARRALYVFMFGTGLISTIVSDVPCAAIFMAIALGIFEKLKLEPGRSQFGRVVMLGIPIAALIGGVGTPAGSSINILGLTMIEQNGGARVPFLHWMAIGIPMVIILLPLAAWVLLKFYPPEIESIGNIDEIEQERRLMGPVATNEWKTLAIMGTMVGFWISSTWYPVFDTTLVAICGAVVMFLPGIRLFSWKEVQQSTGWDTLLMIGGVTSLGIASRATGLAKWLADATLGGIQDWNVVWILLAISAFTMVIHLMLPIAPVINAVMIPPIMALGAAAGVNPVMYALPVIFTASCAFLLPLDAVPLVTYSRGYYRMLDMFLPGLIISLVWVILITALMIFIGPLMGLVQR
jgi:sodium-dependent dicarboxylate transporter 2/3/5